MPRTIHTPLLRDADRRKLSKRTGDTSIGWFRLQGYLPDGFRNFITRLIWTHPDGRDISSWSEFVERFRVSGLRATGPVADSDLLDFINGQYIRMLAPEALQQTAWDYNAHALAPV
jgi:glutamyl/glutaminyl-tRNA synthetase